MKRIMLLAIGLGLTGCATTCYQPMQGSGVAVMPTQQGYVTPQSNDGLKAIGRLPQPERRNTTTYIQPDGLGGYTVRQY